MFLQQDLRLTTSQLNEYMKGEITKTLTEEFTKYEQSIDDAKQLAINSIAKTQSAIEEERQALHDNLTKEFELERERLIKKFEDHMAEIVNHYVLDAVGNEIDLSDQLEYILGEMEANKATIVEDIRSGA
jgi:F0F1-type ATP synthase membrane subunit b/b'